MQKWISVKERLPRVGEEVLACTFDGEICRGYRRTDGPSCQGSEWSLQSSTISIAAEMRHILYWQSLPNFLKKVREEHRIAIEEAMKSRCKRRHIVMSNCGDCEYLEKLEGN